MKKIILTLFLSVCSLFVYSQENLKVKTIKNCAGHWNLISQKYDFGEINNSIINFTFHSDYIVVDDESKSFYRITEQLPRKKNESSEIISAKCLDEKNRECIFGIMKLDDGSYSIGIVYESIIYVYFIESN